MTSNTSGLRRLLATLMVALAGNLALPALAMPGGGGGPGHGAGPMMGGMLPRMLDRVNATPEQREQSKQIVESHRGDRETQRQERQALQAQAMALFSQPTVDAKALEALRLKQVAMFDATSQRMAKAMLEVSRVLTPEQRKQMAEQMSQRREMMQRHQRERQAIDAPKS